MQSTNAAETQVAIRGRILSAWVLRDAGCQQREVCKPPSIQRKVHDSAFLQHGGESTRLRFYRTGLSRNRDTFMSSSDGKSKADLNGAANGDMNAGTELWRHALGGDARRVVPGRQQRECEVSGVVRGLLVVSSSGVVPESDGCADKTAARWIEHCTPDGAS